MKVNALYSLTKVLDKIENDKLSIAQTAPEDKKLITVVTIGRMITGLGVHFVTLTFISGEYINFKIRKSLISIYLSTEVEKSMHVKENRPSCITVPPLKAFRPFDRSVSNLAQ